MSDFFIAYGTSSIAVYEETARSLGIQVDKMRNDGYDKDVNIRLDSTLNCLQNIQDSIKSTDLNVDLIESVVFGNCKSSACDILPNSLIQDSLVNTTKEFETNIKLSSTTTSNRIQISTTSCLEMEEYQHIRKRINLDHQAILPPSNEGNKFPKSKIYKKDEGEIYISDREFLFLKENFITKQKHEELIAFIEDIARQKFKTLNNKCPIVFSSSVWNKKKTILYLYARCIYFSAGCGRYRFSFLFENIKVISKIESNGALIVHPIQVKKQQIRSIRRIIAKHEIKFQKASNWRNKMLCNQKSHLQEVGNDQEVPSADVARKIKSEQIRSLQRDKDPFIDLYKMQCDKKWNSFIQKIASPLEIYMFSNKQLWMLQSENRKFLKMSRNTLFFDATGNIMKKIDKDSKRIFLYSLVAHLRQKEERGLLIPVAECLLCSHYSEDIERFLLFLKTFCIKNGILWPICKRVCIDWSYASINALARVLNKEQNVHNLQQYIARSYNICNNIVSKCDVIVIQICCAHFIRIACKDIENYFADINAIIFFKKQFSYAVNISDVAILWQWITNILTVLLNKFSTAEVEKSLKNLSKIETFPVDTYLEGKSKSCGDIKSPNYKKSPFYLKTLSIYNDIKKRENTPVISNIFHNEGFASLILKKYSPYFPLWTNIMGKYVDKHNTRVSNSPVESYFNITKNVTLEGKTKVVPTEYIRNAYTYVKAKIIDAENIYKGDQSASHAERKRVVPKIELVEETWGKVPTKEKTKINPKMIFDKMLTHYSSWPRNIKKTRYILLSFYDLYKHKSVSYPLTIDLTEFKSLDTSQCLYNNVVDIYIYILLSRTDKSALAFTCEEGKNFFFQGNRFEIPLEKFDCIFMPIIYQNHYTLVYLDTKQKNFSFINSLESNSPNESDMFDIFRSTINDDSWKNVKIEHDYQDDAFNCGIFICQYIKAILANEPLKGLGNPNSYRLTMKSLLRENADDMSEICFHCGDNTKNPIFVCNQCNRPACLGCTKYRYKAIVNNNQVCMFCQS